jgi:hypothetical protein
VLSYQQLTHHPRALRAFTGLDQAEFDKLLVPFAMAYHAYMYDQHVTKKARQRRYGGGRKPRLAAMEDKLFFILFYYKVYPLQAVMAVVSLSPADNGSRCRPIPLRRVHQSIISPQNVWSGPLPILCACL